MAKHCKPKSKKDVFLFILTIVFFTLIVISSIYILKWYNDTKQNKIIQDKIADWIDIENNENKEYKYKIDFEKLKETNNQSVAWLKVSGTQIEHVVVQAENNSYYLNRNFEKKYNKAGWIFADYKNKLDGSDKNIVIYGHNMTDNSMFGTLKNILKEEWYNNEENYIIHFTTKSEEQKYEVFSVYQIKTEDYYIKTEFKDNEFEKFINTLKNRSIKDFNIEVSAEDSILTLSTCANNYKDRIVLHAKKI